MCMCKYLPDTFIGLQVPKEDRGTKFALTSPLYNGTELSTLSFHLFMNESNSHSKLTINRLTPLETLAGTQGFISGPVGSGWIKLHTCLEVGTYYIQFLASYEDRDDGIIGIDNITLHEGCPENATKFVSGEDFKNR